MSQYIRKKEDVVFSQAQEMFPEIEADVIHMVLSEFGFSITQALDSLSLLSQPTSTAPAQSNSAKKEPPIHVSQATSQVGKEFHGSKHPKKQHAKKHRKEFAEECQLPKDPPILHQASLSRVQATLLGQKADSKQCGHNKRKKEIGDVVPKNENDKPNESKITEHLDLETKPFKDHEKKQYIQLPSYIAVGYSNGVRFCFAGNGSRQPTMPSDSSSLSKLDFFHELEKQLSSSAVHCAKILPSATTPSKSSTVTHPNATLVPSNSVANVQLQADYELSAPPILNSVPNVADQTCGSGISRYTTSDGEHVSVCQSHTDSMKNVAKKSWSANAPTRESLRNHSAEIPHRDSIGPQFSWVPRRPPGFDQTPPTYGSYYEEFHPAPSYSYQNFQPAQRHFQSPNRHFDQAEASTTQRPFSQAPHSDTSFRRWSPRAQPPSYQSSQQSHGRRPAAVKRHVMYVLRGAPGSGKSTLAKRLCGPSGCIFSSDDFFVSEDGFYRFDVNSLDKAHDWNQRRAESALKEGRSPIIIDNTNMCGWEMKPYVAKAVQYNYKVEIREPDTRWKNKASELERRNHHGVPKATIINMLNKYERNVTVASILGYDPYKPLGRNSPKQGSDADVKTSSKTTCDKQPSVSAKPLEKQHTSSGGPDSRRPLTAGLVSSAIGSGEPRNVQGLSASNKEKKAVEQIYRDLKATSAMYVTKGERADDAGPRTVPCQSPASNPDSSTSHVDTSRTKSNTKNDASNQTTNLMANLKIKSASVASQSSGTTTTTVANESSTKSAAASTSRKMKKKLYKSADSEKLLADSQVAGQSDWTSFLGIIPSASGPTVKNEQHTDRANERTDVSVWTDPEDFVISQKASLESQPSMNSDVKVLVARASNFHPVSVCQHKQLAYVLNKSTSTEDFDSEPADEQQDLETLQLLFEQLPRDHLRDVYVKCGKALHWATDVIAESSLFGADEDNLINSKTSDDTRSSLTTLDEYYSNVFAAENTEEAKSVESYDDELVLSVQLPLESLNKLASFVGETPDGAAECPDIELSLDLATQLYSAWKQTRARQEHRKRKLQKQKSKAEVKRNVPQSDLSLSQVIRDDVEQTSSELQQIQDDEQLAMRLQMEEEYGLLPYKKASIRSEETNRASTSSKNPSLIGLPQMPDPSAGTHGLSPSRQLHRAAAMENPRRSWFVGPAQSKPLALIMQEEMTAEESEKKQQQNLQGIQFASQLKRNQLHEMYPNVPKNLLDDIFVANDCNFEQTMMEVECIFLGEDDDIFSTVKYGSLLPPGPGVGSQQQQKVEEMKSTGDLVQGGNVEGSLTYDEVRAEANLHRQQMLECRRKAAAATHQSKRILAMYYSSQAQLHKKHLREANNRAAEITYRQMNEGRSKDELDLHGLHVDEAIDTLRSVLAQKQNKNSDSRYLSVITGRGLNSAMGVSKIKNAVIEWLKMKKLKYSFVNDGFLKIHLK